MSKNVFAKTKSGFLNAISTGLVTNEYIGFIEETNEIWARGKFYPCPYTKEELESKFALSEKLDEYQIKVDEDISNLKTKTNSLEELKATKVEVNQLRADTISMIGNISSKLKEINGI